MHHKPGFTLIEFTISMMISSMLMTIAFMIYNQISKNAGAIYRITKNDTQIMILHDRFGADLNGISPLWFTPEHYEKLKDLKKQEGAKDAKSAPPMTFEQPLHQNSKRNKFFYAQSSSAENSTNLLDFFTFITTNQIKMYGAKELHFIRVTYKLVHDEHKPNLFKFMRKEDDKISINIDPETIKNGLFYEVATNIAKFTIEYGFVDKKAQQGKPLELSWATEWTGSSQEIKQTQKQATSHPEAIRFKISFVQDASKPEIWYELLFAIPPTAQAELKSFAEKKYYAQRNAKQAPNQSGKAEPDKPKNNDLPAQPTPTPGGAPSES